MITINLVVLIVSLVVYLWAPTGDAKELAWIGFFCSLLSLLFSIGAKVLY